MEWEGLGTYKKRYRVLSFLKRSAAHFACLQETHIIIIEVEADKIAKKWKGQMYAVNYSTFASGVLVRVAPGVPFEMTYIEADIGG